MKKGWRLITLALIFMLSLTTTSAFAQGEVVCESDVIVQPYDSLWKIAQKAYGDGAAYGKIVEATNAKAAMDSSYATINNPRLIRPGWKLCIPPHSAAPASDQASTMPDMSAGSEPSSGNVTKITFLQVNDVYEMTPVSGEGGVARLATLRKQLLAENPNTYTVLSGDLFSPSALGTAEVNGEKLAGKQMVAAMNAFGLDYATFGNHEFDVKEKQFYQRLAESETTWLSGNVFDPDGLPLANTVENMILTVTNGANQSVRVGLFGVTLPSNPVPYVSYTDPFEAAKEQVEMLKGEVDLLIAITHLSMAEDKQLVEMLPDIDLVMGGHEHENAIAWHGPNSIPIAKADANARTAYIHELEYNHDTDTYEIEPRLQAITSDIPDDPEVAQVVDEWVQRAFDGFREQGFEPENEVTNVTEPLDGTEASVRNKPTRLTELIAESMLMSAAGTDLAIFNGGAIRIDDTIPPGPITEYDVIRIMPFGGTIMSVEMTGTLLKRTLDQGQANAGMGGYLQLGNVTNDNGAWMIKGQALNEAGTYQVAINDFLLTGKESNLGFLNADDNPELTVMGEHDDLRQALIDQLQITYGAE